MIMPQFKGVIMLFFDTMLFLLLVAAIMLVILGLLLNYGSNSQIGEPFDRFKTAVVIRQKLRLPDRLANPIAIILGTGWGDVIVLEDERSVFLSELPGFKNLPEHPTHKRQLCFGFLAGRPVFVLRGRVHMNEAPCSTELANIARLQIEMLCAFEVKKFILTAAVGGLLTSRLSEPASTERVCVIDGFVTLFAPDIPLYSGEYVNPEDTLDPDLRQLAVSVGREVGLDVFTGGHVMVRGPFFEGRRYDKIVLTQTGAQVVGMSILPEACVAALHDAKVLALGFVSNTATETHSDELIRSRAQEAGDKLGALLSGIIVQI